jgi:hypothetical protein
MLSWQPHGTASRGLVSLPGLPRWPKHLRMPPLLPSWDDLMRLRRGSSLRRAHGLPRGRSCGHHLRSNRGASGPARWTRQGEVAERRLASPRDTEGSFLSSRLGESPGTPHPARQRTALSGRRTSSVTRARSALARLFPGLTFEQHACRDSKTFLPLGPTHAPPVRAPRPRHG